MYFAGQFLIQCKVIFRMAIFTYLFVGFFTYLFTFYLFYFLYFALDFYLISFLFISAIHKNSICKCKCIIDPLEDVHISFHRENDKFILF
jgi:hypothetical protein